MACARRCLVPRMDIYAGRGATLQRCLGCSKHFGGFASGTGCVARRATRIGSAPERRHGVRAGSPGGLMTTGCETSTGWCLPTCLACPHLPLPLPQPVTRPLLVRTVLWCAGTIFNLPFAGTCWTEHPQCIFLFKRLTRFALLYVQRIPTIPLLHTFNAFSSSPLLAAGWRISTDTWRHLRQQISLGVNSWNLL